MFNDHRPYFLIVALCAAVLLPGFLSSSSRTLGLVDSPTVLWWIDDSNLMSLKFQFVTFRMVCWLKLGMIKNQISCVYATFE